MKIRLKINPEKCSGCHLCEMACSIYHLGVVNTDRSAIRVLKDDLETGECKPVVCIQCKKMLCMDREQPDPEAYHSRFIWEKSLSKSCPFDALVQWKDEVYHCNLCGGSPQCVKLCSTGAIRISAKGETLDEERMLNDE
jgi:Fe-S-cluster-containing hydrogenase component 2